MPLRNWKRLRMGVTDEKLAEAGIGASNKSSAQDVLARLQRQQGE